MIQTATHHAAAALATATSVFGYVLVPLPDSILIPLTGAGVVLAGVLIAALFAGLTVAWGSRYLAWMEERARRLAVERDQQTAIATAAERTRIARELHDIVSHSLSVVITSVLHVATGSVTFASVLALAILIRYNISR